MVLLGARLADLFRVDGVEERLAGLHPLECLSLAHCYETLHWAERHRRLPAAQRGWPMARAHGHPARSGLPLQALGRPDDAAAVWENGYLRRAATI